MRKPYAWIKERQAFALSTVKLLLAPATPPDLHLWASLLSRRLHLRVADRPIAVGHDSAMIELTVLFRPVLSFGTGFQAVWPAPDGETVLVETDIIVAASPTPLPIAMILRLVGRTSPIRDMRFYLDPTLLELPPPPGHMLSS